MKRALIVTSMFLFLGFSRFFGTAKKPDPDQLVLDQLKKAGSNLAKPHHIEFFVYFPTKDDAVDFAAKTKDTGFEVALRHAAQCPLGFVWQQRPWFPS